MEPTSAAHCYDVEFDEDTRIGRAAEASQRSDRRLEQIRMPPHNVEAEQAVLGAIMLRNDALDTLHDWLHERDFYRRDHQLIYRALLALRDQQQPCDAVTAGEWFEAQGLSEHVAGGAYLVELASTTPSAANVDAYASIVHEKAVMRELIEFGTEVVNAGFQNEGRSAREISAEFQRRLAQIAPEPRVGGSKSMKEISRPWFDKFLARLQGDAESTGLLTPWGEFNRFTNGLKPGDLSIIAGRPSMGKSAFAVNLAVALGARQVGVFFISLEMVDEAIYNRAVATIGEIPMEWLARPEVESDEGEARSSYGMGNAMRAVNDTALRIDDQGALSIEQIEARARREFRVRPFKLLVVDHLHIVELPGKVKQDTEIGNVTRRLKALAKELNCHVMALAQLNRGVETRTNHRPKMSDLRESGNIEQDADLVVFLYRDDYYAEQDGRESEYPGHVEYIIAKQREGRIGKTWARERFEIGRLDDCERPPLPAITSSTTSKPRGRREWSRPDARSPYAEN